jgi:acyl carrier protein
MAHPTTATTTIELEQLVTGVLVETLDLPAEDVVPAADLRDDLGLDSLDLLELLAAIEAHVGTRVEDTDVRATRTVGDAVALVERLQRERADR